MPNAAHRSGARKSIAVSAAQCSAADHQYRHLANGHAMAVVRRGVGVADGDVAAVGDYDGGGDDGPTTVDTRSWP